MTIKPLIILPDPILRQVSDPVERIDDAVRAFADDMLETMYDAPGIGPVSYTHLTLPTKA